MNTMFKEIAKFEADFTGFSHYEITNETETSLNYEDVLVFEQQTEIERKLKDKIDHPFTIYRLKEGINTEYSLCVKKEEKIFMITFDMTNFEKEKIIDLMYYVLNFKEEEINIIRTQDEFLKKIAREFYEYIQEINKYRLYFVTSNPILIGL